jgi:hypothetical protein
MFELSVSGGDAALAGLSAAPVAVQAALRAKAAELAQRLKDHVVQDKLAGQVLNVRSGALRDSIAAKVDVDGDTVKIRVFSDGDVKYARIQEFGGHTPAHLIVPNKARALAFLAGGKTVFAHIVHHPGSQIPARSYLRSALDDMSGQIIAELKATMVAALQGER